jgi:DNA-directed RNA polymerase specialized sigma24 family protein
MRRLARQLCRQGEVSEDLAQESWAAALAHPPQPGRPARPWLAQVLRNVVRMHRRGQQRRRLREARAADQAVTGAPDTAADTVVERIYHLWGEVPGISAHAPNVAAGGESVVVRLR